MTPLTDKQHAAVAQWWGALMDKAASEGIKSPARKVLIYEWQAAGFEHGFTCATWAELRSQLPNAIEVLGRNIIARHRLRV